MEQSLYTGNGAKKTGNYAAKRSDPKADMGQYVFGKVQPQAIQLEEAVLGAIMLDREALPNIMDVLRPESFYLDAHQEIYRAAISLWEHSEPIDLLTVTEQLRRTKLLEKVGGGYYLVELSNRVASSANIEYHARIIAQKFIQRELIRVCSNTIKDSYEDTTDVFDVLDGHEQNVFSITAAHVSKAHQKAGSVAGEYLRYLEKISNRADENDGITGIPSGIQVIDKITAGWQPSDMIIVAARPGMGKTAFALSVALNAAREGRGVGIFSLEMATTQLVSRFLSILTEIPLYRLRRGKLDDHEWQKMQQAVSYLDSLPVFIDDTPGLNIFELRAKARRMVKKDGVEMIILDYIQLMSGVNADNRQSNREQDVSNISRGIKTTAKEVNVPIIALSQLSRAVETRGGAKRPQLSDLRESGSLEQDSDIVGFLYRPEYYGIMEDENGNSLKGMGEFIIAKHRNGSLDTVKMKFVEELTLYRDLDDAETFEQHNTGKPFNNAGNRHYKAVQNNPSTAGGDASFPTFHPGAIIPRRQNEEDIPF